ncbi:hypothetical protein CDAR_224871 [Caerostris darwini]|uniref:Uncharacterized protein n=1 Tax=Caerostris darwini TaxID=1538125 RepID=A0AAV4NDN7_9ARAC|nr:hypothetical protein CDAR_224871 [Caerostris darwini]
MSGASRNGSSVLIGPLVSNESEKIVLIVIWLLKGRCKRHASAYEAIQKPDRYVDSSQKDRKTLSRKIRNGRFREIKPPETWGAILTFQYIYVNSREKARVNISPSCSICRQVRSRRDLARSIYQRSAMSPLLAFRIKRWKPNMSLFAFQFAFAAPDNRQELANKLFVAPTPLKWCCEFSEEKDCTVVQFYCLF